MILQFHRNPLILLFISLCIPTAVYAAPSIEDQQTELNNQGVRLAQEGDLKGGIETLKRAYTLDPKDREVIQNLSGMLTDWGIKHLIAGHIEDSIQALAEASAIDVTNAISRVHLGDLYYTERNESEQAIHYWREAFSLLRGAERDLIAQRLEQAERDLKYERGFTGVETPHFVIRFSEVPEDQLETLKTLLEEAYTKLADILGPLQGKISVIVYPAASFERIIGKKDWALGLYDGKIRLRIDELSTEWPQLILPHELAHAFLRGHFGAAVPLWVHEGFAQAQEPEHIPGPQEKRIIERVRSRNLWVPLEWVDKRFEKPSHKEDVEAAYVQSKLVVEHLLDKHGVPAFTNFLRELSKGLPMGEAFDNVFHTSRWGRITNGSFL